MSAHDPHHDELMERAVAGEQLTQAERDSIEACAVCGPRLAEFAQLITQLDLEGAVERERVLGQVEPQHESHRSAPLPQASGGAPSTQALVPRRALLVAATVLASASLGLWILTSRAPKGADPGGDPTVFLSNEDSLQLLPPGRDDAGRLVLSWRAELPRDGGYNLLVWAGSNPTGTPVVDRKDLQEAKCIIEPDQERALGQSFYWRVDVFDAGLELEDSADSSSSPP